MAKRNGNPNWGKPRAVGATSVTLTSFEELVKNMNLSPAQYKNSLPLKEWVRKNKDHKYVPPDLLRAWGFEVKSEV